MGDHSKSVTGSPRILLIDDSDSIQRLMHAHLTRDGVRVTIASDGRQGVAKALESLKEEQAFNLILMDLNMPVMNGWQAIKELRQKGYTGNVVALSADTVSLNRQKWRQAGFDDYAVKPISKPNLRSLINKFCS